MMIAPRRPLGTFGLAVLIVVLQVLVGSVSAHRLEVDELSVQYRPGSDEVTGQLLLDPDVTRPGGPQSEIFGAELDQERARLFTFIREHFVFRADNQVLDLSLELREVYVKGGAVPADSVVFHTSVPKQFRSLSVQLKPPLDRLAVTTTFAGSSDPAVLLTGAEPLVFYEVDDKPLPPSVGTDTNFNGNVAPPVSSRRLVVAESIEFVWTGIIHIIPFGWDHILFVVALTLSSLGRYRRLILELTAFTAAHTVTLALGALRLIVVPASFVEPLIALSIAVVAVEHLSSTENRRFRLALVAGFGLLHGLGFASALLDLGFSGGSFVVFLASFNLGVELGQLAVVVVCIALFLPLARWPHGRETIVRGIAVAIALCGLAVGFSRILEGGNSEPMQPTSDQAPD